MARSGRGGVVRFIGGWTMAAVLGLAACGGGGGNADPGTADGELAVTLGQPGPGDPDNFLPLAVGNVWVFRSTLDDGVLTETSDTTISITGTRSLAGATGFVMQEVDPQLVGEAIEQVVVKDANGVAVLAETGDGPTLAPYWAMRLPLQPGAEFVQLDRRSVDLGEDLDGDARNETADLRSVVRMVGTESVAVPAGTFTGAVRVRRELQLTIRLTANGETVAATEQGDVWLVRGVGWVRRTSEIRLLGQTLRSDDALQAYTVGASVAGMAVAGQAVASGSVAAGGRQLWLFRSPPAGDATAALTGLTGDADLTVLTAPGCLRSSGARAERQPEDCGFDTAGPVVVAVDGVGAARYLLSLAATPSLANPADESRSIVAGSPVAGQVGPRGESRYAVGGLAPGRVSVSIAGLSADADLKVYADGTYSFELDCTLRAPGDVLPVPDDCSTDSAGSLFFSVRSGELNTAGASYLVLVHPAP